MSNSITRVLSPKPRPIDRLLAPLQTFARHSLAGAGLLMLATLVAIVWANSRWASSYEHLLHLKVALNIGSHTLSKSLHHWINDGLMSLFFFMVGLEIKRELMVGELSSLRKATLPAVAAVGGMLIPAAIFVAINPENPARAGWGIPMATDIAFALGVLALLGKRVPLGLKVFLTALAIVDDIGAVTVIAIFYTSNVAIAPLVFGLGCIVLSGVLNALGARNAVAYLVLGILAWLGFLESGVHATIAAILMAFTIPARTRIDGDGLRLRLTILTEKLEQYGLPKDHQMNTNEQQHVIDRMQRTLDAASAPLQRIEHSMAGAVNFAILPLFALANAGVRIEGSFTTALADPVVLGIVAGLVVGKTVGVAGTAMIAVKLGIADLPDGVGGQRLLGAAMLAGVGFTMALFVASLAYPNPATIEVAKVGVLVASTIAGFGGYLLIRTAPALPQKPNP